MQRLHAAMSNFMRPGSPLHGKWGIKWLLVFLYAYYIKYNINCVCFV